jgi:hypothetical protein
VNAPLSALPPSIRRRFWSYEEGDLVRAEHRGFLLGRLLEEGDAGELQWLFRNLGRPAVTAWLSAHGSAALSRRSRAFWTLLLGVPPAAPRPLARDLWPLA